MSKRSWKDVPGGAGRRTPVASRDDGARGRAVEPLLNDLAEHQESAGGHPACDCTQASGSRSLKSASGGRTADSVRRCLMYTHGLTP